MCNKEIAESKIGELIFIGVVGVGATINVAVGRIGTGQVVPSRRETVLIVRG